MIRSRDKMLGVALLTVLGLMALAAAGAQAEKVGVFLLDGKAASNGTITASLADGRLELDSTVGANNVPVKISCKKIALTETTMNEKDAKGTAKFTECEVLEPLGCTVHEPIVAKALALPLLHKSVGGVEKTYILFHPWEGTTTIALLTFLGACILPEHIVVKGLASARDCEDALLTEQEVHLLEEVHLGLGEDLKFGAKPANILGSALFIDQGHKWSAH